MSNTVKKIGAILSIIVLFTAVFLFYFEYSSYTTNEKIVEQAYSDQLDAILFSVNQYSGDLLESWSNKLQNYIEKDDAASILNFISENESVQSVFYLENSEIKLYSNANINVDTQFIQNAINKNKNSINKLFEYAKSDYRKIENFKYEKSPDKSIIAFIITNNNNRKLAGIIINEIKFIRSNLASRLRTISQNKFNLLINNKNNITVFSTNPESNQKAQQLKPLWLLPEYSIGISLAGETITEIFNKRNKINIILISILLCIIIAGTFVVFKSIKKEIELAQVKTDFVSNVSHELRTPLSLISMFAETLELGRVKTEEKKQEYYKIISNEAGRLSKIVNSILNFSKMEAGKIKFNLTPNNINEIVKKVYDNYKFHLNNNGVEFEINQQPDLPLVNADAEAVSEAVINLLDNAVKYSEDNKNIKLLTYRNDDVIIVEVSDNGIGISEKDINKLFEKFYRVSTGYVHNTKGTGLGLTIVKHIMDAHNGNINVESEIDKGSKFKLIFPVLKNV